MNMQDEGIIETQGIKGAQWISMNGSKSNTKFSVAAKISFKVSFYNILADVHYLQSGTAGHLH